MDADKLEKQNLRYLRALTELYEDRASCVAVANRLSVTVRFAERVLYRMAANGLIKRTDWVYSGYAVWQITESGYNLLETKIGNYFR